MTSTSQKSNSPGVNFGQLDAQNVSDGTSINLFQGNLSMPVEVISLPGLNGLNCDLALNYQSQVTERVDKWNLEDSPSISGMGWDLSFPQIIKDDKFNATESDNNYFLMEQGNPTRLIPNCKTSVDQIDYELENYAFYRISYYPSIEKWEIQKEDGTLYTYGGQGNANTLQWGIRWGNWIGPSSVTENQERYVKAWNLSKVENIYGNFYCFGYQVKEQCVGEGTLTYTKECVVNKIQNDLDWSLRFEYKSMTYDNTSFKSPKEYLDPYRDPTLSMNESFSDTFQSCYLSIYLDNVALYNQNNQLITKVCLDYYNLTNLSMPLAEDATIRKQLIYGATYKRYLKSIQRYYANGETKPGTTFFYNFSTQQDQPRGVLNKIIYSTGGQSIFNYQKITIGADEREDPGSRNICIQNPFGIGQTGKPRIWYGQDYTISAWYDEENNRLRLNVFTWVGHWCISHEDWWEFDGVIQLDKLQLAISENCFCLAIPYDANSSKGANTDVFLFSRDHLHPSLWIRDDDSKCFETTSLTLENGHEFFLVYDSDNKSMVRYFWHPFKREFLIDNLSISSHSEDNYFFTAYSNYYIIYCYNSNDQSSSEFTIDYCDELFNWKQGSRLKDSIYVPSINSSRYCAFGVSDSFAALASITKKRSDNFDSEFKILMWDSDFSNLKFAELEEPWGDDTSPFKYIPNQIAPYLGPIANENSLASCGPNTYLFNGNKWLFKTVNIHENTSFSKPQNQFYWYAFQSSGLLKTENTDSGIYSSLNYPDINGNNWSEIILEDSDESSQSKRVKQSYPTFINNYISLGTKIYSNPLNQDWQVIDNYFIEELSVEDNLSIDTTTIINQAPYFFAFMTLNEEGDPYDTRIGFFRNGDFIRDEDGKIDLEILPGQQVTKLLNKNYQYKSSLNGQLPAIAQGFVTYSVESKLDESTSITLHHYATESLQDPIETFVVQQMISESGYNQVCKCYDYENVSAAQDSTQTRIRFQKVTEYQACLKPEDQKNGYTISYFANGIPSQGLYDHSLPSALDGILLKKEQYDSGHSLISYTETQSEIISAVPKSWTDSSLRALFGAFMQTKSKTTMLDGVTTCIDFEYLLTSGRVASTQTSYWDSQGQRVSEQKVFTYGCEKYQALQQTNRLTELVQTQILTKTDQQDEYQTKYSKVQTYKQWESSNQPYWAEVKEYLAIQANAIFDWTSDMDGDEYWLCTKTIIQRDNQGNVLECEDTEKISTTVQYDDIGRFPIASFTNASLQEGVFYESFEPYQNCSLYFSEQGGGLYNADAFTGTTCYKITQSGTLAKTLVVEQETWEKTYCLSAYLKTNVYQSSQLEFRVQNGSEFISKKVSIDPGWFYFQWIMDLTELNISNNQLDVQLIVNLDPINKEYVQLDNLSFRPIETLFSAEIYDSNFLRQIATLGNNGACDRVFYNQFQDQQAIVGAYSNVIGFRTAFLSSQVMQKEDTSFPTETPNMELIVRGQELGFYDTFKENALDQYTYMDSDKENWLVQQHQLQFVSSAEDKPLGARVKRQDFQSNNLAICVSAPETSSQCISIGVGNFFIVWNGTWNLYELKNENLETLEQNSEGLFGREWIGIFVKNRIVFFANGLKIFDTCLTEPMLQGSLQLGMQKPGSFEQLLVVDEVEMDINYTDGFGNMIQTLKWESPKSTIIDANLYDSCGRDAIQLKPARVLTSSVTYLNNWTDSQNPALWQGDGIQGTINDYYAEDHGYPFSQTLYEDSPLDRVIKIGKPGEDFAITPTNKHVQTIDYRSNTENTDFKYKLPANCYFLQTITDADGCITHYYRDIAQHLIGVVQEGEEGNRYASWSYDHNGDLIEAISPNYYNGLMDETGVSTYQYNFLGRQIASNHPDTGQGNFIYDHASMVRIYQDAQAQAENFVNYIKYDNLGRISEKGYLDQDWDLNTLQKYALDSKWPEDGNWTIRYQYDGDDSTTTMLGNLWKTSTANSNSESPIIETFEYDLLNCLTLSQRTIHNDQTIKLESSYSCCGILSKTLDNQTNLEMTHIYNSLGQLIQLNGSVGTNFIPSAQYSYTATGMIENLKLRDSTSELLCERHLDYNSPQWLTNLHDAFVQQQLTYISGAYGNSGYYTGKVASQSMKTLDQDFGTSCFEVDQWNRLVTSKNPSMNENWEIDLNNNFQNWTSNSITRTFETIQNRNQILSIQEDTQKSTYTYTLNGDIQSIHNDQQQTDFSYYKGTSCLKYLDISDKKSIQFEYNGENLRATKIISAESQIVGQCSYFYNESEKPSLMIQKTDSKTTPLRFVQNPFLTILFDGQNSYFALKDHLDSTHIIIDNSGNVCAQYDYTLYGKPTVLQRPPIDYNYLFTGHEYDFESGFYNMEIRLYDPDIGRFLMTDPKAEFFSPYVYVGNNPLMATDPTGRMSSKSIGWIALIVGVIASVATAGLADAFLAPAAAAALGIQGALATGVTTAIGVTTGSVAGAFASQAVTAGANHESFFTKSLGTSLLANLAGGAIGAGIGAGAGSAMKYGGSRASSKAISGASQGLSKTTKKVGQEVIKEMSGNVSDSLVNSAINGAFGDDWNGMDGGLVALSLVTGALPTGIKKYRKVTRSESIPELTSIKKIDDNAALSPSVESNSSKSTKTNQSTKKTSQSSSVKTTSSTVVSRVLRSNTISKRTKTYSFKQSTNLSTPSGRYTKTHTFAKELHSDAVVSPRD